MMTCSTLQASLFFRPSPSLYSPTCSKRHRSQFSLSSPRLSTPISFNPSSLSKLFLLSSSLLDLRFRPIPCSLRSDNFSSDSDLPVNSPNKLTNGLEQSVAGVSHGEISNSPDNSSVSGAEESRTDGFESNNEFVDGEEKKSEKAEESGVLLQEKDAQKARYPVVVFLMGVWAAMRRAMEKALEWEGLSWWPFMWEEKRLKKLIAEADANPKDAALQSALLAELNKHRFGICIADFVC